MAILSSLIGVFYYFRVIYALFKEESGKGEEKLLDGGHLTLLILAGLLTLVIGLAPGLIQSLLL